MRAYHLLLLEKQNYQQMFDGFKKQIKAAAEEYGYAEDASFWQVFNRIDTGIEWARKNLKRNDRVVWYLRFYRLEILNSLARFLGKPYDEMLEKARDSLSKKLGYSIPTDTVSSLATFRANITHYFSLDIPAIENYQFRNQTPTEILAQFEDIEDEWKERKLEADNAIVPEDTDKKILEFNDGSAWWWLSRPYCEIEGESMGHCGNRADYQPDDKILSFRKPVSTQDNLWSPHLTFVLHDNGMLGEMKGRGNTKPAERYHPYIIELLQQDFVKGISGGGHDPENNFKLSDLEETTKEKLVNQNPGLGSLYDLGEVYGYDSDEFRKKAQLTLDAVELPYVSFAENGVVIKQWSDLQDLVSDINWADDDMRRLAQFVVGDEELQPFEIEPEQEDIDQLLNSLPDDMIEELMNIAQNSEDPDFEREVTTENDLIDWIIESQDADDYFIVFRNALEIGLEAGTLDKMTREVKDSLSTVGLYYDDSAEITLKRTDNGNWYALLPYKELAMLHNADEVWEQLGEDADWDLMVFEKGSLDDIDPEYNAKAAEEYLKDNLLPESP